MKLQTLGPNPGSGGRKKSHQKVTTMVLTVITVYVLCYLPYWVLQIILLFTEPNALSHNALMVVLYMTSAALTYLNSAVNPILYAFLNENFRQTFKKACVCADSGEVNRSLRHETSFFRRRRSTNKPGSSNPNRKPSASTAVYTQEMTAATKLMPTTPILHDVQPLSDVAEEGTIASTQV